MEIFDKDGNKVDIIDVVKSITDDDLLSMALKFGFSQSPKGDNGELLKFNEYKSTFMKCAKYFRDNFKSACNDFLNSVETKS